MPAPLTHLITRAVSKNPAQRPPAMADVIEQLAMVGSAQKPVAPAPGSSKPWARAIAVAAAAALLLAGASAVSYLRGPEVTEKSDSTRPPAPDPKPSPPEGEPSQPTKESYPAATPADQPPRPKPVPSRFELPARPSPGPSQASMEPSPSLPSGATAPAPSGISPSGVLPPPPPPEPSPEEIAAKHKAEIQNVIQQFVDAHNAKNLRRVVFLWPSVPVAAFQSSFQAARQLELLLTAEGDPLITESANGNLIANVRYKRYLRMIPKTGPAPPVTDDYCVYHFEQRDGKWKISRLQDDQQR